MDTRTVDLYSQQSGEGFPLVLLHGFPLDHTIWQLVLPALQGKARLILPDLRGHGRSPAPEGVYPMRQMAEDVAALLDSLNIERVALVGHSMGGYISLAFAEAYPERLAGLALVASHSAADAPERRQGRYNTAEEVRLHGLEGMAEGMSQKLTRHPGLAAELRERILKADPTGVIGALKGMAERPEMGWLLSTIAVPVMIIAGGQDSLLTPAQVAADEARLKRGKTVWIPEAGHMPMMEAPSQTAAALAALVDMLQTD